MMRGRPWRLLLLFLLIAGAAVLARDFQTQLTAPVPLSQPQVVEIPAGAGFQAVIDQLQAVHVLHGGRLPLYLRVHAQWTGLARQIKAGEYEFKPGMSALDALHLLVSGKGLLHPLRIGEASNFSELMAQVQASPVLRRSLTGAGAEAVMSAIGRPGQHPEGRFFPDTYHLARNSSDLDFLRRAADAMDAVLAAEWQARAADLPYASAEEALVMASIVEKETGVAAERAQVAGVFINRLRRGIRLQTDPSVIYGLGDKFDGNLRRADLLADTPYNTYTRGGLPPTPICMPGRAAIHAALHPAPTEALFFVARGDGSHVFSETLEQHNAAVRRYQLRQATPAPSPAQKPKASPGKPQKKTKRREKNQG